MLSNLGKTIEKNFKTSEQRGLKQWIKQGIEKGKEEAVVIFLKLGCIWKLKLKEQV